MVSSEKIKTVKSASEKFLPAYLIAEGDITDCNISSKRILLSDGLSAILIISDFIVGY